MDERELLSSLNVVVTIKRPLKHRALFWAGSLMVRAGLFLMGVGGLVIQEEDEAEVTDCGYACGPVTLFAPEAGCPVHDPDEEF
jgi:hypothetical protein